MTRKNRVIRSINNEDESRCVDIFLRPDTTYGFEEYRRDSEDNRGWFAVGFFAGRIFINDKQALETALSVVPWLRNTMAGSG